jgi:hypothetical protein
MYVKISIQMCCLKRYKSVLKSNYDKVYDICIVIYYLYTLIILWGQPTANKPIFIFGHGFLFFFLTTRYSLFNNACYSSSSKSKLLWSYPVKLSLIIQRIINVTNFFYCSCDKKIISVLHLRVNPDLYFSGLIRILL